MTLPARIADVCLVLEGTYPFVRGGVSGIGAITALAGLAEIAAAITSRRPQPTRPESNARV